MFFFSRNNFLHVPLCAFLIWASITYKIKFMDTAEGHTRNRSGYLTKRIILYNSHLYAAESLRDYQNTEFQYYCTGVYKSRYTKYIILFSVVTKILAESILAPIWPWHASHQNVKPLVNIAAVNILRYVNI